MNVETNELRMLSTSEVEQAAKEGFEPVPPHLQKAAKRKLNGKKSAQVSRTSGGELSKWAAEQRKKKRKHALTLQIAGKKATAAKVRTKKKAAKESRRNNRR